MVGILAGFSIDIRDRQRLLRCIEDSLAAAVFDEASGAARGPEECSVVGDSPCLLKIVRDDDDRVTTAKTS